ncbi:MAG: thermonuclease family protein, partial [Deltaproteobacteria bacterium]|nr:thermonuclease family protein [Deltaproteobacteria bacterium]
MWRLILVVCLVARAAAADDLVIGDFKLVRVVDGDTIRVDGLDNSLRLLGLDTEETFKHAKERRAYAAGWDSYVKGVRGDSPRPVKFATPMGDEAKAWAERFFAGVTTVRLERDDADEIRDRYKRYLAYVLVERDGQWLNYNVEAVRAGMAPYFPKYGRSRRYHDAFVKAEAEAKAA